MYINGEGFLYLFSYRSILVRNVSDLAFEMSVACSGNEFENFYKNSIIMITGGNGEKR